MDSNTLEKIKKLLNLATKNTNAAEMEAAMAKAIEIATLHGIDLAKIQIGSAEKKKKEYSNDTMYFGSRMPIVHDYVSSIVREFFNTKIVSCGNRKLGRFLYFVGTKEDIEMSKFVYSFLSNKMMDLWHGYHAQTSCAVRAREPYFMGVYGGLHNKLENQRKQTESESNMDSGTANQYAIMIRNNKQDLELAVQNMFSDLRQIKPKERNTNDSSYYSGYQAGQNVNIARPIGQG